MTTTKVSKNGNMHKAKAEKNDEFYTQLSDIEKELNHYKDQFRGKVVYCNCDDPEWSNFFKYFSLNFEFLGLKKLITTHYGSDKKSYKLEITGDTNGDGKINQFDTVKTELVGNGDFSSPECIELLNECDIVVSNPPFSLARLYLDVLINSGKQFLFISNLNAITYKEFFKNIKENKLWLGYGFRGGAGHFINQHYEDYATATDRKEGMIRVSGVHWFTNLDITKRHEDLILYKTYNPKEYPKFDHYDAINVDKTNEIPIDYEGNIGVPITFLNKYSPEQFEIIDGLNRYSILDGPTPETQGKYLSQINGNPIYVRIVIKNKKI